MELKEHLNKMKEMYPILSTKYNNKVYGTREDDRDEIVKMMADLRVLIKQGVNKDDNYLFHNSTQTGSITYNPYIVIKNKNISFVDEKRKESPRNDYYIVIYFDTNFDNLHISLNQGSERDNEDRGLVDGNITDGNIRDISLYLRRYFIPKIYNKFEVGEGKLQTGSKKTSEYNNTNIWSVTFSVDNSFSDLDFFSDLNIALDVYNEFIIRLELNKYDADYINKKISRNINNKIYDLDFRTTLTMISDGEKDKSQCNAFNDAMAKYDLFNREKLISSLINLISSPRTGTPISIGLFGDWGVGKSSLINLLGIRIKNQNETIKMNKSLYQKITKKLFGERNNVKMKLEHTVKVIHIDASQYDDREKLWAGISIELYKAYIKENKYLGYIKLACKQINKLDYLYVLFLDLILVGLYVLSEYVFGISKGIFTNRIILTASGYLVILLSYWIKNLIGLVKKSRDKKPMNKHVEKLGYKMRVTEEIKMLTKLLQGSKWFSKKNTKFLNRRIVIVIDELDRSNHEKILEAVEAIQLLVDMEDLITILSLNFEIACNVIGKRQAENKGIYDNEVFFKLGKSFLEKYVSLPIYLDSPTSYDEFIISMIEVTIKEEENGEEKGEEKREENTSVDINLNLKMEEILGRVEEKKKFKPDLNLFNEEEREKMIEVTKDIIRISPELINGRGIKRLINILIVLKSLLDYEQIYISFINVIEFVVYLYVLENNIDIKFEEKIKLVNKFIKIESKIFKDDGLTDRTKIIELIRIFFYKSEYLKYEELKEIGQGY